MSRRARERVDCRDYRPAESVPGAAPRPPYWLLSQSLREEWRLGRVGLVLEDGYLMQRVPPVINLEAAQGSLPSWTRPPIHQLCQQTTDKVRVCSSEAWWGENLYSVVSTNTVIRYLLFLWNCVKDSPIGTNLKAFCTKSLKFSSRSATITAAPGRLYHFMINPWLKIKFLSFVHHC